VIISIPPFPEEQYSFKYSFPATVTPIITPPVAKNPIADSILNNPNEKRKKHFLDVAAMIPERAKSIYDSAIAKFA
jgi:hypothetical protein